MGPTAPDKPYSAANATGIMRPTIAQPAMALSPNGAMAAVTNALPTGVASCVNTDGRPIAKNGLAVSLSICLLGRASRWCTRTKPYKPTHTITARAMPVASAAPSKPQPKPKIKIGSSTATAAAALSVTYMARLPSPKARSSALRHMPAPSSGMDGSTQLQKRSARSAVTPVAPNTLSKLPKKGYSSSEPSAKLALMSTSEAPAKRLAFSRSPWPSARDVSALTAMAKPIDSETIKNSKVPAYPTAAANSFSPNSEM